MPLSSGGLFWENKREIEKRKPVRTAHFFMVKKERRLPAGYEGKTAVP
jgi:hypothetical protein